MDISIAGQVFVMGITMGFTACLLTCAPLMSAYVIGTKSSWHDAFKQTILFSAGKLLGYMSLGAVSGFSGKMLERIERYIFQDNYVYYSELLIGISFIILAVYLALKKDKVHSDGCKIRKHGWDKGLLVIGFLIGISPCPPLIIMYTTISLLTRTIVEGTLYGLIFGLGNFVSPLLLVGPLTGILGKYVYTPGFTRLARILSIIVILYMSLGYIFIPLITLYYLR